MAYSTANSNTSSSCSPISSYGSTASPAKPHEADGSNCWRCCYWQCCRPCCWQCYYWHDGRWGKQPASTRSVSTAASSISSAAISSPTAVCSSAAGASRCLCLGDQELYSVRPDSVRPLFV